jgi:hypothetical protein
MSKIKSPLERILKIDRDIDRIKKTQLTLESERD